MSRGALILGLLLAASPAAAQETQERKPSSRDNQIVWTSRPVSAAYGYLYEGAFGELSDLCYDPQAKEVWVADRGNNRIGIFDGELLPKFSFGGKTLILQPRSLVVDPEGDLVTLYARPDAIRRFNYRGDWLGDRTLPPNGTVPRFTSLDLAPEGVLLVGEASEGRLIAMDAASGEVLWTLGSKGAGPEHFLAVAGAAYSPDGEYLYVLDQSGEPTVQVFRASDREYLFGWGAHTLNKWDFSTPVDITVAPSGLVLIVDTLRQVVKVYDSEGEFVMYFGGLGSGPGGLGYPAAVAMGEGHQVFVAEKVGRRVQSFELFRERRGKIPEGAPFGASKSLRGPIPADPEPQD